ncbi:hypothetical protein MFFC18_09060 [Mariniblastus fucicola]|uniref:Uncharacterized protein n=1 Tax=Mariniblastus fucicola TaxID=980251 RepID=A0A5B9P493_9BACT|nr:hypothetical protein MFFC18_09060 [Mariniblastus fucicola]
MHTFNGHYIEGRELKFIACDVKSLLKSKSIAEFANPEPFLIVKD